MDPIKNFLRDNPVYGLIFPAVLSVVSFGIDLIDALKDGHIDATDWQKLSASSSGLETLFLVIMILIIKKKPEVK